MTQGIPFNKLTLVGNEFAYMQDAITNGHASGNGPYTRRCESLLKDTHGSERVLLTTSCTHALEICALLLDIKPGDEIIMPAFTFVSTANAFVLFGAKPVFVDIRPDTLNLDPDKVARAITPHTKAIVAVHYAGVGCELQHLRRIADEHNLVLIEDNAQGLFGKFKDQYLGTYGDLSTVSFHETKNISCGEGGALFINNARFVERAEIIREKGTNRSNFFKGYVDKYTWVDKGSSYLLSDVMAAFLLAQLERHESVGQARAIAYNRYAGAFAAHSKSGLIGLPVIPSDCGSTYHLFYLMLATPEQRDKLIQYLKSKDILAVFHYVPLHLSPMGKQWNYQVGDLPVTEDLSSRLVRLPLYHGLEQGDQERVIMETHTFLESLGELDTAHPK